MRYHPGSFDLSFQLPRPAPGRVYAGLQRGIVEQGGCALEVELPFVRIRGGSQPVVFNAAAALLLDAIRSGPAAISAILHTPLRPSGFDRWHIIVGAPVAFAPGGIDPYFPRSA
ncbi:hypothetical protein IVB45_17395 [Bradyrhizobium sp. 4]|uniref:hypothetical protein n=1 Tax=unclassified Bradyrhizobium TaxID=2631580 RepID=UPI001FF83BBC|nr:MULTISPECIES: hypothetical protein [unclassified Bradyrhizobium]MCK1402050.1 hypothetical protein [Bradyrhizobium sp. 39]MCK1751230.1 hypothetical protein [Bradyrhizobium sp. 135]UPJ38485.1 hypothetical protein IVB45_17395 [Bradyrhizobium sp. 4]